MTVSDIEFEPITRLKKDIIKATSTLTKLEVRFVTDLFYQTQESRKSTANQIRSMDKQDDEEPHLLLDYILEQNTILERQIVRSMDAYTMTTAVGRWLRSIIGIGPILAANFISHLDITRTETAGGFWKFAGLDPTSEWKKGEKRPWNASLKTACWKLGDSFVKVSGNKNAVYGQLYKTRKLLEVKRNDNMEFTEQAKLKLEKYKIGKTTDAYKSYSIGKLPAAHLDMRARRYAVKIFLAHLHEVMYREHYNKMPPNPYILEHGKGKHVHRIIAPNYPPKE